MVIYILLIFYSQRIFAHETWLLTGPQLKLLSNHVTQFQFTWLHSALIMAACLSCLIWIVLFRKYEARSKINLHTGLAINRASFLLRIFTAIMLFICSFGLIPKTGSFIYQSYLLAPDLLVNQLSFPWKYLNWLQIIIAILLLLGVLVRLTAVLLIVLCGLCLILFGKDMLQYLGFYLGIAIFLKTQGAGEYSLDLTSNEENWPVLRSLFALQFLTGLNFIYSAIYYKFLNPNFDLAILATHHAFTFGMSYHIFVFIMALVEFFAGIIFILGYGLRFLCLLLLILFSFLSINVHENILAHSFIYGILLVFIITKKCFLFNVRSFSKEEILQ